MLETKPSLFREKPEVATPRRAMLKRIDNLTLTLSEHFVNNKLDWYPGRTTYSLEIHKQLLESKGFTVIEWSEDLYSKTVEEQRWQR